MASQVPKYDELPETFPGFRCSWEYFNSKIPGQNQKDQLGTLNFLTPDRKAQAARENILTGQSISLDHPINHFVQDMSAFGNRPIPTRTTRVMAPHSLDDSVNFNTQSASQWDGFRHFGFRSNCLYYNGYGNDDFVSDEVLSIHSWAKAGGICGRGILIDFLAWAERRGEQVDVNSGYGITLETIKSVLESQRTTIRPGDILVFRTGWLKWYNQTHATERHDELCIRNVAGTHKFIGLAQEPALIEWIWNNQIAAVAGDQVALERTPPTEGSFGWLHEHLLAAMGCPIGELWDTEELAEFCAVEQRYEFFLASIPLCMPGGVASPSNAVALV